ncbi:MAG: hypothetical protein KAT28_00840 [Candidatus Aenigmarchaeota archaeon]|nr:hypothetical protein [Candidatus Aenigmarchaeota archaeon]
MVNIDEYYDRVVERIDNTNNRYLRNFERGVITSLSPIPGLIESIYEKPHESNSLSLCSKTNKAIFYPNDLNISERMAHIGGIIAGITLVTNIYFAPWVIIGALDAANYIQRKDKE